MSSLLIGLLSALVTTNPPAALSNAVAQTTGITVPAPASDPVEKEYQALLDADDDAQAEVDQWIQDNHKFAANGAGTPPEELNRRIKERFEPVRKGYEAFLNKHPDHSRARVAYASFLGDLGNEEGAQQQLEKALESDTNNPAIYNNLANIYGHTGPVKKAFEFYSKAIALAPTEPVYYHNFGTTVYLFRTDAKEYYSINEQQVFDKAFMLYSNALRLDPTNFPLATDVAQTYYAVKPLRTNDALVAWTNALLVAHDEIEREGVYVHFARVKMLAGRLAEARAHLAAVTNAMYAELKGRVARAIADREHPASTNASPAAPPQPKPQPK